MATQFLKGSSQKYNEGIIRKSLTGLWVAEINRDGKRRRKSCDKIAKARKWIDEESLRRYNQGKMAFALSERQHRDAANALSKLEKGGYNISLSSAIEYYIKQHPRNQDLVTLQQVLDLYVAQLEKPKDGGDPASPETVKSKKKRVASFIKMVGERDVRNLTVADVETWVGSFGDVSPRTILNRKTELQSVLNFAETVVSGFTNEICKEKQRKSRPKPATILEPSLTEALIREFEKKRSKRYAVTFALMCFAGIRPDELLRAGGSDTDRQPLTWDNISLENRQVTLHANNVKVGGWREVPIQDNLYAWLKRYPGKGRIAPSKSMFYEARRDAMEKVGMKKWTSDIARHSFASYAGILHGLHTVAGWMGHEGGLSVFNAHYKGRATRKAAETYFSISPCMDSTET